MFVHAEIVGYGTTNDYKPVAIPSVEGQAATMRMAIKDSGLNPSDIQYINAHGTGTKFNDATEPTQIRITRQFSKFGLENR